MKIILIGPQGAGKGTIGAMLSEKYNIPLLGTGQMFREAIKQKTELGRIAEEKMNKGELVPAEITANLIKERVNQDDCNKGYLLDGFPRNLEQAELFGQEMDKIDMILHFDAPQDLLIHRLTGRRMHKETGKIYNIHPDCDPNPPEDINPKELYQREDDKKEAIKQRLEIYDKETKPILEKYKEKVKTIDAQGNPDIIFKRAVKIVDELDKKD